MSRVCPASAPTVTATTARRRATSFAKLTAPVGSGRLTVVANGLDQPDAQDPLGLTRPQFETDPRQADSAAALFNTRKSVRQAQLGLVHEIAVTAADSLQARLYGGTRSVLQFLPQAGDAPLASGGVVDLDRRYGGAGVRWTRKVSGERPFAMSVGVERDGLDEWRRGFVNNFGTQGALRRDEDDTVTATDIFAQGEWRFAPGWSATAGARRSRVAFVSQDRYVTAANPDDSGTVTYARTMPVAGLLFEATPAWRLYASAGEGFETIHALPQFRDQAKNDVTVILRHVRSLSGNAFGIVKNQSIFCARFPQRRPVDWGFYRQSASLFG